MSNRPTRFAVQVRIGACLQQGLSGFRKRTGFRAVPYRSRHILSSYLARDILNVSQTGGFVQTLFAALASRSSNTPTLEPSGWSYQS